MLGADGAGIWQGAAGPAYGLDSTQASYVYFKTGNGVFDANYAIPPNTDYGDSLIKMTAAGSGALKVNGYFTPADQYYRANKGSQCSDGDVDFGSGGVMLIPEGEMKDPYLAISGDKEGGIWFNDRTKPGLYGGSSVCPPTGSDSNVQTYQFNGGALSPNGPVIHTSPAFWDPSSRDYLYIGSQCAPGATCDPNNIGAGKLLQFSLSSGTRLPIQSPGVYAHDSANNAITFEFGATPTISAATPTATAGVLWAIWADGSVEPSPTGGMNGTPAVNGQLYAFDAISMVKLYGSNDCTVGGTMVDQINPATKFSVPTVADQHVYVGTQGPLCSGTGCNYANGGFYIFGQVATRSCGT